VQSRLVTVDVYQGIHSHNIMSRQINLQRGSDCIRTPLVNGCIDHVLLFNAVSNA